MPFTYRHKAAIISFFLLYTASTHAQEVNKGGNEIKDSLRSAASGESLVPDHQSSAQPIVDFEVNVSSPMDTMVVNPRAVDIQPERQNIMAWKNGGITGYHGSYSNILSYRNVAGAMALQQWGNLTVTGGLSMSRGIGNGIGIVNGLGGNMTASYRLSDNVILNAFGGMNHSGFMGPAPDMASYYYGGYVTLLTNNGKWGMDMGVRRVYNSFTGRWETIPVAMPYYNLNGAKLGIDVGGILYSIFSGMAESKNNRANMNSNDYRGPAIIAPPIDTKVKLSPIETPKWVEKQYDTSPSH